MSYYKGRRFEYEVIHHFKELGFFVMRSAASKGCADIFAADKTRKILIQCKVGLGLPVEEWNTIFSECERLNMTPMFAARDGTKMRLFILLEGRQERSRVKPMAEIDPFTLTLLPVQEP